MFHSKNGKEDYEEMIKSRLVTQEEVNHMKEANGDPETLWWMPLCWATKLVNEFVILNSLSALKYINFSAKNVDGIITDPKELIGSIVKFKAGLEAAIEDYDHIPLPPVYSQVYNQTYS